MTHFDGSAFWELLVALTLATLLGFTVGPFLAFAAPPKKPDGVEAKTWAQITELESLGSGRWVGLLETVLFVGALFVGEPIVIGAWLTFKVAAKWEVWANVVKIPDGLVRTPLLDYQVRHRFGSVLLSRFLLGTLLNVLVAAFATATATNAREIIEWLF